MPEAEEEGGTPEGGGARQAQKGRNMGSKKRGGDIRGDEGQEVQVGGEEAKESIPRICLRQGGCASPRNKKADLPYFASDRANNLLKGVYEYYPNHNDGVHLGGGVPDDAVWQHRWCRLVAQSTSWYATPSGSVGSRFKTILAEE